MNWKESQHTMNTQKKETKQKIKRKKSIGNILMAEEKHIVIWSNVKCEVNMLMHYGVIFQIRKETSPNIGRNRAIRTFWPVAGTVHHRKPKMKNESQRVT